MFQSHKARLKLGDGLYLGGYLRVSIPQGSIKTRQPNPQSKSGHDVSIPQGSIKTWRGDGANRPILKLFQSHKARLKPGQTTVRRKKARVFQSHKARLKLARIRKQ